MGNNSEHDQRLASQAAPAATLGDVLARLDAIEGALARIEAAMRPRYVVTTGEVGDLGVVRAGDIRWTEQQDPTSWAPSGVVDPDDRAALQRMAARNAMADEVIRDLGGGLMLNSTADKIEGADCASGREPMGEGEYKPYTDHIIWGDGKPEALRRTADTALSAADEYIAQLHAAAVDARRESKRHARKWWLLWLA